MELNLKEFKHEEFVGAAVQRTNLSKVLDQKAEFKTKDRFMRDPWISQGLKANVYNLVGVDPTNDPSPLPFDYKRTDWGAIQIQDEALWLDLYRIGTRTEGKSALIGSYYSPEEALKIVKQAMEGNSLDVGGGKFKTPTGKPEDELLGDNLDERCVWDSSTGTWSPKAGCASMSNHLFPQPLRKLYSIENTGKKAARDGGEENSPMLLPLVLKQRKLPTREHEILSKIAQGYIDTGVMVKWKKEMGLPTVVTPLNVVLQPDTSLDPDKEGNYPEKPRAILDFRYVNSIIRHSTVELPTVPRMASKLKKDKKVAKQDLKSGCHQYGMETSSRHMCAVIWEGVLYALTVMSFGLRNAPEEFQKRTSYVANKIQATTKVELSDVYLDDFIQETEDDEPVIRVISQCGFIMSKKKLCKPSEVQTVLGIIIDTHKMQLRAPESKIIRIKRLLKQYSSVASTTTQRLAELLGLCACVEPAIPFILLFCRPLYDDLKDTLVHQDFLCVDQEIPCLIRNADSLVYQWIITDVAKSAEAKEAATYLLSVIDDLNGQQITLGEIERVGRVDSSENGWAGTLLELGTGGVILNRSKYEGHLDQQVMIESSTARESCGLCKFVETIPDEDLLGRTIMFIVDNKGLARRHWIGSRCQPVNEWLIIMAKRFLLLNVNLKCIIWAERAALEEEDSRSRRDNRLVVNRSWFTAWSQRIPQNERPNIDAFSADSDHVLDRFCTIDFSGTHFDGASCRWDENDRPWIFPPIPLITKAWQNWKDSDSKLSYWCLPNIRKGHWWTYFTQTGISSKRMHLGRICDASPMNHEQVVMQCRKGE